MGDIPPSRRRFCVLGPIEVMVDDRRIDLGGAKPRALLAALIANRNQVVSTDALIDALWGERPPTTARKSLQKFVSALRKQLGEILVTRDPGYLIEMNDDELDAASLEVAVSRARSSEIGWEGHLKQAMASWRGNPYPELADTEWAPAEVSRLIELRVEAEELLVENRISRQDFQGAIARLEDLVSSYPYRERFWALLMTALYGSGRQADALEAYQRLRSALGDGLGIEPSAELNDLEERILLQDPALKPAERSARPHNLPAPVTSFIGRQVEIDEIMGILATARLVTLLGPAGSGKTRLATELGRRLPEPFHEHGVWFVDLAPVNSPEHVITGIAEALGVGQFAEEATREIVAGYLSDRRIMLILDNCEHLVESAAEVVAFLLRTAETLVVITTSRERLGIDGEVIYDVPPLPYPSASAPVNEDFDAVRLFLERARNVSRGDEIRADPQVGEIVRRLDGIPLALELAAARVRSLGLSGVRDRLDDRFSLLTSPRGSLPRHQTLEAALEWSYRLLNSQEQTLFKRLSVFSGGFDLQSAAAVCGFDPLEQVEIADLVAELADKSLVSVTSPAGARRYYLLESVREYASQQLDPAEDARIRQAHMIYFRDLARQSAAHMRGPEQAPWFTILRLDHDNLRRALRWAFDTSPEDGVLMALALGGYWDSMGPRTEGNAWLARAVETSADLDPRLHVDALIEAAAVASSVEASIPVGYARRAVDMAGEVGDEMREARALRALSWALAIDEQPEAALEAGRQALGMFERLGDPWEVALTCERLGQGSYRNPEWSVEMLERALRTYRQQGDRNREALALHKIADRLAHSLGDIDRALAYARRSVEICRDIGSTHDAGHAHLEYGKVLRRAGQLDMAITELKDALDATTKVGDERCSIRAQTALGNAVLEAGKTDEGHSTLEEALRRSRDLGETHTTRSALAGLARLHAEIGRPEIAAKLLGFVEEWSRNLDIPVSDRALEKRETERAGLRRQLGEDFDALWKEGRSMSLDDATDLALSPLTTS